MAALLAAIDQGANNWDDGLLSASYYGHLEAARLMVDRGAKNLDRSLTRAQDRGHRDVADFLMDQGACGIELQDELRHRV
jgi:ankyrin repeat protein